MLAERAGDNSQKRILRVIRFQFRFFPSKPSEDSPWSSVGGFRIPIAVALSDPALSVAGPASELEAWLDVPSTIIAFSIESLFLKGHSMLQMFRRILGFDSSENKNRGEQQESIFMYF